MQELLTKYHEFIARINQNRAWRVLRPITVFLISAALVVTALFGAANYIFENYISPVDINDATPIMVTIDASSSASTIAKVLYEAGGEGARGIINNKAVFKIYVDFIGKASQLQAGTFILSRNMTIPQIVDAICQGETDKRILKFTINEGLSVLQIGESLVEQNVLDDPTRFYELCKTGEAFQSYDFIDTQPVSEEQQRDFALEGYLFPDTYNVYVGSSEEVIINKMLTRFNEVFHEAYIERAEELDMSVDAIVTLASIIEKEARTPDFTKVSAVFHTRLNENDLLGADATVHYIYQYAKQDDQTHVLELTAEQLANPSLYNTRLHPGLPLGPISNPGQLALEAALSPDEVYLEDGYYYFVLKSAQSTELVFAITAEEHAANVAAYKATLPA